MVRYVAGNPDLENPKLTLFKDFPNKQGFCLPCRVRMVSAYTPPPLQTPSQATPEDPHSPIREGGKICECPIVSGVPDLGYAE